MKHVEPLLVTNLPFRVATGGVGKGRFGDMRAAQGGATTSTRTERQREGERDGTRSSRFYRIEELGHRGRSCLVCLYEHERPRRRCALIATSIGRSHRRACLPVPYGRRRAPGRICCCFWTWFSHSLRWSFARICRRRPWTRPCPGGVRSRRWPAGSVSRRVRPQARCALHLRQEVGEFGLEDPRQLCGRCSCRHWRCSVPGTGARTRRSTGRLLLEERRQPRQQADHSEGNDGGDPSGSYRIAQRASTPGHGRRRRRQPGQQGQRRQRRRSRLMASSWQERNAV